MLEKKRENLGKGGEWGAFFTDLSKDCLTQDLSLAKLNTSGFGYQSITLISGFLSNRK